MNSATNNTVTAMTLRAGMSVRIGRREYEVDEVTDMGTDTGFFLKGKRGAERLLILDESGNGSHGVWGSSTPFRSLKTGELSL